MKRNFSRRARSRGFTLLEMMIVLTIIGLLLGMVIMNLLPAEGVAQRQKARADILGFKEALAGYQLDNGTLPTTEQGLSALWAKPTAEPIPARWHAVMEQGCALDPWGRPYQYLNPGKHNPDKYDVFSLGPDGSGDSANVIGNWDSTPAPAQAQTGN